jgi:hypothetical protein
VSASPAVSAREQLDWEARWAKPAAAAAFAAALLLVVGTIVRQAVALNGNPDDEREFLIAIDGNAGGFLASAAIQAMSFLALAGVLVYLGRAVLARKPELPRILIWLGVIGPLLLALAGVLSDVNRLDIADQFLASGAETVKRAEDLLEDRSVLATSLGSAGTLALAIAFVLFSVNAMRVGLLTRFMGIVGAIVGVLYVIPLLAGPLVVQLIWLLALGVLFLGHWPGGRGPAWETGEAVEWPSGLARQPADDEAGDAPEIALPQVNGNGSDDPPTRTRTPRKRKKKRR